MPLQAELGTSLPSLQQGCELTMTILLVFQMERSRFSALILGTALPLLVFNLHHPSYTRGIPTSLPLNSCIVTACPGVLSTSVPCQGLGASNPSPSSRSGAVGNTRQCLFCLLPTELPWNQAAGHLSSWLPTSPALPGHAGVRMSTFACLQVHLVLRDTFPARTGLFRAKLIHSH